MKIKLFRAPYVDECGVDRVRIQAIVLGAGEKTEYYVSQIARALRDEDVVFAFVDDDVEVEWL